MQMMTTNACACVYHNWNAARQINKRCDLTVYLGFSISPFISVYLNFIETHELNRRVDRWKIDFFYAEDIDMTIVGGQELKAP
jgi:hypothetical protein